MAVLPGVWNLDLSLTCTLCWDFNKCPHRAPLNCLSQSGANPVLRNHGWVSVWGPAALGMLQDKNAYKCLLALVHPSAGVTQGQQGSLGISQVLHTDSCFFLCLCRREPSAGSDGNRSLTLVESPPGCVVLNKPPCCLALFPHLRNGVNKSLACSQTC